MTLAEVFLWQELRPKKLGVRFRRQEPIGPYIVDFACIPTHLIVEAAGEIHDGLHRDVLRDAWLRRQGYRVLPFWNEDIVHGTDLVVDTIKGALCDPTIDGRFQS